MTLEDQIIIKVTVEYVKVTIRCKETKVLFSRALFMTRDEARGFKAQWDFHHIDGDFYVEVSL